MTDVILDSYNESNGDTGQNYQHAWSGDFSALGETFKTPNDGNSYILTSCKFLLDKTGSPDAIMNAQVYDHSGTFGSTGVPTGAALAVSDNINASSFPGSFALVTITFSGVNQIILQPNTPYCIALVLNSVTTWGGGDQGYIEADTSAVSRGKLYLLYYGSMARLRGLRFTLLCLRQNNPEGSLTA